MSVTKDQIISDDFHIYYTQGFAGDSYETHFDIYDSDVVWGENADDHEEVYGNSLKSALVKYTTCYTGRLDTVVKDRSNNYLGDAVLLRGMMNIDENTKQGKSRPGKFTINFTEDASQVCLYPQFDIWHEWYNAYMLQNESMAIPTDVGRRHVLVVDGTLDIDGEQFESPAIITITDQEAHTATCVTTDVVAAFCIETE